MNELEKRTREVEEDSVVTDPYKATKEITRLKAKVKLERYRDTERAKNYEAEITRLRSERDELQARVQELAEFVADKIGRLPLPNDRTRFADGRYSAFRDVYDEIQRLRQQADEIDQ